ncbi:MAG: AbrB/MazE/SpoVT family DNA-binding domain-containing protein [Candidatus Delongbacteria bacterium]
MTTTTMTTKGQVTIPKQVRDELHLHSGDKIEITVTKDGEAVLKPVTKTVDEVFGILYKKGRKAKSIEEMDEAVRKGVSERFNESN